MYFFSFSSWFSWYWLSKHLFWIAWTTLILHWWFKDNNCSQWVISESCKIVVLPTQRNIIKMWEMHSFCKRREERMGHLILKIRASWVVLISTKIDDEMMMILDNFVSLSWQKNLPTKLFLQFFHWFQASPFYVHLYYSAA